MTDSLPDGLLMIVRKALETQIAQRDPPDVEVAFARLRATGCSEDEAWRRLAQICLRQLEESNEQGVPFDRAAYIAALSTLHASGVAEP
jgi:hypothetical protein